MMKSKLLFILIPLILCLSLSACVFGGESEDTPAQSAESSTPESTPVITPEDTPPETNDNGEPSEEELALLLEQLDAVCKEQIHITDDGPSWKVEYRNIENYYGEIDLGHVFQIYVWRQLDWGAAYPETIGDYYFSGYYGGNRNNYIYIYDGEKLIHLLDAYNDGLISDSDLDFVFHRWLEKEIMDRVDYRLNYSTTPNGMPAKYNVTDVCIVTESEDFITYLVKSAPTDPENIPAEETLKLGEYEFKKYGETTLLYTYCKSGDFGLNTLEHFYKNYVGNSRLPIFEKLEADMPAIHKYWEENCVSE